MIQVKTYQLRIYPTKVRIYPTKEQEILIQKTFGCCRQVYNQFLAKQRRAEELWFLAEEMYQSGQLPANNYKGSYFNANECKVAISKELKPRYEYLKEVDSIALQDAIERLDKGYKKFYGKSKSKVGKPRFKSKRNKVRSYTTKNSRNTIEVLDTKHIKLPKLRSVKYKYGSEVQGIIKTATIKQVASGKYYAFVVCEVEIKELPKSKNRIGLDVGLKDFCIDSNGKAVSNPKFYRADEKKLGCLQRKLARQQVGSVKHGLTQIKLAKLHEKIASKRKNFLHQVSKTIINENQVIVVEDLNVKGMVKNKNLSKSILDVGWNEFFNMLEYKARWYGRELKKAPRNYASSQLCSSCGYKNKATKDLSVRSWECPECLDVHDRDINAAKNLLKLA